MSHAKPVAFVTGTSTGFGNLIASDLARDGFTVFATMRDTASRNAVAKSALEARGVVVLDVDLNDDGSVDAAAKAVHERAGAVDLLVNNAGSAYMGVTEAFTADDARDQFESNVFSTVRVNRAFLPAMREAKSGLVVYVSSVVGRMVIPFTGLYAASKWALEALAESMSYELRPFGVDVTIVEPGAYGTNITKTMKAPTDEARLRSYGDVAKIFEKIGEGLASSAGDAQEVADAVVALAKLPAGTRPLRSVVGGNDAVIAINASAAPYQTAVIEGFGLGMLLSKEAAKV